MNFFSKEDQFFLLIGDLFFLFIALWFSLFLRYLKIPSSELFFQHAVPFSVIFLVWVLVFFIAGLYERQAVIISNRLAPLLFNTQVVNSLIAVLFFYFIPYFGITPKTNLFIDLVVSFVLIYLWRLYIYPHLGKKKIQSTLLIGSGREMQEILDEVNHNTRYGIHFSS